MHVAYIHTHTGTLACNPFMYARTQKERNKKGRKKKADHKGQHVGDEPFMFLRQKRS